MQLLHLRQHNLLERTRVKIWLTTDDAKKREWMIEYLVRHPLEVSNPHQSTATSDPIQYIEFADNSRKNEKIIENMKAGWRTKKYKETRQIIPATMSLTVIAEKKLRKMSKERKESKSKIICDLLVDSEEVLKRAKEDIKFTTKQHYSKQIAGLENQIRHLKTKLNNQKESMQNIFEIEKHLLSIKKHSRNAEHISIQNISKFVHKPSDAAWKEVIANMDNIQTLIMRQVTLINQIKPASENSPMSRINTGRDDTSN